jgi:hypothetical protein
MCTYFTLFAVCSIFFELKIRYCVKNLCVGLKLSSIHAYDCMTFNCHHFLYDSDIVILSFLSSSNQPDAFLLTPMNFSYMYVKHTSWDLFEWLLYNVHCIVCTFSLLLCHTKKNIREIGKGKKGAEKNMEKFRKLTSGIFTDNGPRSLWIFQYV